MKKIILNLAVSLDGFIEGPNGEIVWCIMDDDMDFDSFLDGIDTLFYGRVSYDAWGNFVPEANADESEKAFWQSIHTKSKYVFSRSEQIGGNATLINTDLASKVAAIKAQSGKDIWLYGGANLIKTFISMSLIDEYRISVHPVVLGSGKPLFEDVAARINLKLLSTRTFRSGVVELTYRP